MSNISEHKPHLYLSKTGNDYQLAVALKVNSGEILNANPTSIRVNNGVVTVTCEIVDREGNPAGYQRTDPIDLSAAMVGANETVHVVVMKRADILGEQGMLFTDADLAGTFTSTDKLPFLRLVTLGNNRYRPSIIIIPGNWTLNEQKTTETVASSAVRFDVTIDLAGGRSLTMDDLSLNRIEFTDPNGHQAIPGEGVTAELNGNPRRKPKITPRTANMP